MKQFIVLFVVSLLLISCGKFADGTSVWQEGMWIIPSITFLAGCWFMYIALRASRSGSWWWGKDSSGKWQQKGSDENIPIFKIGQFWFAVIFWLSTIGIIIWVNLEK
jgi:hypothetical protein